MKKYIILFVLALTAKSMQAQGVTDALRFAQTSLSGSARFSAMGGAFGALGGDLSSMNVNPAGSVIFANNQVGGTLTSSNTTNDSKYFGNTASDKKNSFDLNQAGFVFVFDNDDRRSKWNKFALAINYDNSNNFDNSVFVSGTNPYNSIDRYFLSYADGIKFQNLNYNYSDLFYDEQQAYLGYNSYIIEPLNNTGSNTSYITNVAALGNYNQQNSVQTKGNNGKVSFNISAQYDERWSFGLNLNSHFSDFRRQSSFYETNGSPSYATGSTVNVIRFNNDLQTKASGFSLQLGIIFKPVKEVRFGLAYESPTWYRLEDKLSQNLVTSGYGLSTTPNPALYSTKITNPGATTVFEPYNLQTPSKTTASFAYVFGKKGLISTDFAFKNYAGTQFTPKNDFSSTNDFIDKNLNLSKEIRVGAEYKIEKVSLRAGYRWEETPFKTIYGDLTAYSGGLGFNFGSTKLDLSYVRSKRFYNESFFNQGLIDKANISEIKNNFSVSLLFEL